MTTLLGRMSLAILSVAALLNAWMPPTSFAATVGGGGSGGGTGGSGGGTGGSGSSGGGPPAVTEAGMPMPMTPASSVSQVAETLNDVVGFSAISFALGQAGYEDAKSDTVNSSDVGYTLGTPVLNGNGPFAALDGKTQSAIMRISTPVGLSPDPLGDINKALTAPNDSYERAWAKITLAAFRAYWDAVQGQSFSYGKYIGSYEYNVQSAQQRGVSLADWMLYSFYSDLYVMEGYLNPQNISQTSYAIGLIRDAMGNGVFHSQYTAPYLWAVGARYHVSADYATFGGNFSSDASSIAPSIHIRELGDDSVWPATPPSIDRRLNFWGSFTGAANRTSDLTGSGLGAGTSRVYLSLLGATYHLTPTTLVGLTLGGAATDFDQASFRQNSDAFVAGVYGRSAFGRLSVAGFLDTTANWLHSSRFAGGDAVVSNSTAQTYAGRLELGYAAGKWREIAITPFAAFQDQVMHTPGYGEIDLSGGSMGVTYNTVNRNDPRTDLGVQLDTTQLIGNTALRLRARAAWAHDFAPNETMTGTYDALPGTGFAIIGATIPRDSAITMLEGDLNFTPNWGIDARFDSRLASTSQIYAGTVSLRYIW